MQGRVSGEEVEREGKTNLEVERRGTLACSSRDVVVRTVLGVRKAQKKRGRELAGILGGVLRVRRKRTQGQYHPP